QTPRMGWRARAAFWEQRTARLPDARYAIRGHHAPRFAIACAKPSLSSLMLRDGDRGPLLVKCHTGCEPRDILAALRRDSLLGQDNAAQVDRRAQREDDERDRVRRIEIALGIWREARSAAGTPVEAYLRHRAISGPIPPTIRYHAALLHVPT